MEINAKVADFALQDDQEKTVHLKDFAGKPVVLFFYPKADTPGCTTEAKGFSEHAKKFAQAGAVILGVSPDQPAALARFKEKYKLPFTLLSDTDHNVANAYGTWVEKSMYGRTYMGVERSTFLIDKDGKIKNIFRKVKPATHPGDVCQALKSA